jgi:3-methylfumaryl-CoA hydratase
MGNWENWIGKSSTIENYLDATQARKMQVLLDQDPTFSAGDELPPAWHWLYFHELTKSSNLGKDGHTELGISMPAFSFTRRMWAGGNIQWIAPIMVGQNATRKSQILSISEKTGRSGDLIFVTVEHQILQNEKICLREEQNVVYRADLKLDVKSNLATAKNESDFSKIWQLDETDLFRYSALTFNSHRIHYDQKYATETENYPGLIVHGPLLSTLILDLAKSNARPINQFTYRASNPIHLPNGFSVHGKTNNASTELWVANQNGSLAMAATLS